MKSCMHLPVGDQYQVIALFGDNGSLKVENCQFVPTAVYFNALTWGDSFRFCDESDFAKTKSSESPSVK